MLAGSLLPILQWRRTGLTVVTQIVALDHPFLLLPFRPTSDPSAVRTFVRHFFDPNQNLRGEGLLQELRMTEPMVGISI